jgi:hypothetical protein
LPDDVIDLGTADVADLVLTFSRTPTRVSGSISNANRDANDSTDVIVFLPTRRCGARAIINNRRARLMHATSAATFEFSGLDRATTTSRQCHAIGTDWQDPSFLELSVSVATKLTLGSGEEKTCHSRHDIAGSVSMRLHWLRCDRRAGRTAAARRASRPPDRQCCPAWSRAAPVPQPARHVTSRLSSATMSERRGRRY